jgi:hypothetical protein
VLDIFCADPLTGRQGLLIRVQADADGVSPEAVDGFVIQLFRTSIRVGLLMTPLETVVVRDALSSMAFRTNQFLQDKLETAALLKHAHLGTPKSGPAFESQVRRWIEAVGESWFHALPPEAVGKMVPDVVGHITGAALEESSVEQRDAS